MRYICMYIWTQWSCGHTRMKKLEIGKKYSRLKEEASAGKRVKLIDKGLLLADILAVRRYYRENKARCSKHI